MGKKLADIRSNRDKAGVAAELSFLPVLSRSPRLGLATSPAAGAAWSGGRGLRRCD